MDLIGSRLLERPRDHWLEVMAECDVPSSPVLTTQEYMDVPQVRLTGMVQIIEDPRLGETSQIGMAIDFSETPGKTRMSAPELGQHTDEVLALLEHDREHGGSSSSESGDSAKRGRPPKHPLEGMKVLDLSSFIAAPYGSMILSDLGADVIKVEPLSGEGKRAVQFLIVGGNRGKRNLALDLKSPAAKEIINRLLASCDVVVHNMREGVAERLGIDYESARKLRPDVIYAHVTGYGSTGPDKLRPGFDPLFQSMSGTTVRQGASADRPVFLRTPICDSTNAMLLASGVLMALHHRDRTGQGQKIDLSLLKTAALVNSDDFLRYRGKADRPVADNGLYGMSAVNRLYKTADGWIFLDCNQAEEWDSLRECLGNSRLEEVTFDQANKKDPWNEDLCRDLAQEFERLPAAEWEQRLVAGGAPCCRVAENVDEGFFLHPQALHLGLIDETQDPQFTNLRQAGVQVWFSETPSTNRHPAAAIGQHSAEVLKELGYNDQEIADPHATGCIGMAEGHFLSME
jgi:crotonobetainyl-CoA:carnitine CoA-transferase CaiB-like acyl-CoA transferase